jgi:hypothetical protein
MPRTRNPNLDILELAVARLGLLADERTRAPYNQKSPVPGKYGWPSLAEKDGDELFDHYRHTLEALGNRKGLLGLIFNKSQNKFQDPAKLRRDAEAMDQRWRELSRRFREIWIERVSSSDPEPIPESDCDEIIRIPDRNLGTCPTK